MKFHLAIKFLAGRQSGEYSGRAGEAAVKRENGNEAGRRQ